MQVEGCTAGPSVQAYIHPSIKIVYFMLRVEATIQHRALLCGTPNRQPSGVGRPERLVMGLCVVNVVNNVNPCHWRAL